MTTRWRCTVKTPSNWLQTVYVEAYSNVDAVSAAEHSTGGKCIMATPEFNTSSSDDSEHNASSSSEIDGGSVLGFIAVLFLIVAWKYILLIGGIAFLIWGIIKYSKN
jgi:hypothetical protein